MKTTCAIIFGMFVLSGTIGNLRADIITLDFEGFLDGASITTEYPGIQLINAVVITSGVSLNEFEFPPHSGSQVVFDSGGPIELQFAAPVLSVGAFFTYGTRIALTSYDGIGNPLSSVSSMFSSNLGFSGEPGSSPNEFLEVSNAVGISKLVIAGDAAGGSFVMDDVTYESPTAVPEPASWALYVVGIGIPIVLQGLKERRRSRRMER